jgi:hypothetical protein
MNKKEIMNECETSIVPIEVAIFRMVVLCGCENLHNNVKIITFFYWILIVFER